MAAILAALVSIAALTTFTWWLSERKLLPFPICAICAGCAGTWLWLLAGILSGFLLYASYMPVVGTLMGGSVVGIAYQSEKYLKVGRSALLWKTIFIPIGFGTVWSVTHFAFGFVILGALVFAVLAGFFLELPLMKGNAARASGLEEQMKECC